MRKTPRVPAPVAELLDDPIIQMLMRADNVTQHELAALMRGVRNKIKRSHLQ